MVPVLRDGILRGTRRLVGPFATHSAAASAKASIVAIPALCASRPTGFGTRKVGNKEKGDCLAISKLESGYQRQRAKPNDSVQSTDDSGVSGQGRTAHGGAH